MRIGIRHYLAMLVSLAVIICMAVTSCSDHNEPSNPDSPTTPTSAPTGELEFVIDLPTGSGDGSNASPAIVNGSDTLSVSITQSSAYKDPDGTVFTCEPKASIVLYAESDTVYAKDIAELTQMAGNPDISNDKTTGSLAVDHTVQKFRIGDQSIVFDLSHEILTHVNSAGHPVEMPYVRLNPAKFGSGSTTEEKPGGRCAVGVTGVTVRPIAATRGETVRDTAMYEVNVRFNLEAESVNTPGNEKQTIEFSVNYVGGVETVTKLLDPVASLSYGWNPKSGTLDAAPPFASIPGSVMEMWMEQRSSYTDKYGNVAEGSPVAKIRLTEKQDTVWVSSVDELKNLTDLTQDIAPCQSAVQRFGSDLQEISIEWDYENAEAVVAGETVAMPHYALSPVTLKEVEVKELRDDQVGGRECTLYEVNTTFTQKATPMNVTGEAADVEIEYIARYIGAMEIKCVMVEYYPVGEWQDPHDNMPLAYFAAVERYRTYSNGRRVGPDRFEDYGHFLFLSVGSSYVDGYMEQPSGEWVDGGPLTKTVIGDSIVTLTQSIKVWEMGNITTPIFEDKYELGGLGDWDSRYHPSNDYSDESFNLCKGVYCPDDWEEDSRPNGWYYADFSYVREHEILPDNYLVDKDSNISMSLGCLFIGFTFYDQFLVIDGRRIDFSRLHNLKLDFNTSQRDLSEPGKEGKIVRLEMNASYLGKNFYAAQTDSIYMEK